jgi:hypothetical protein
MTVMVATPAAPTRNPAAKKKVAKKVAAKKPEKVRGIGRVGNKFEVVLFLGSFDKIEDAIACREKGLAFRESLKAAPRATKKKAG